MRYEKQQIDLPFIRGVDGSVESRMQQPGALSVADNYVFEKPARLAKRPALAYDSTLVDEQGAAISGSARRIGDRLGNGIWLDGSNVYEYSADRDTFTDLGPYPEAGYPEKTVIARSPSRTHVSASGVELNGFNVYAWIETGGSSSGAAFVAVYSSDGTLVSRQRVDTNGIVVSLRLFAIGSETVAVVWNEATAPLVWAFYGRALSLTGTYPTLAAAQTIVAGVTAPSQWDACGDSAYGFVTVYESSVPRISTYRLDTALAVLQTANDAGVDADTGIGIFSDGTNVWIGCGESLTPRLWYTIRASANLASVLIPTTITAPGATNYGSIVWGSVNGTTAVAAVETYGTSGAGRPTDGQFIKPYILTTAGGGAGGEITHWVKIESRMAKWNGKFYMVVSPVVAPESLESMAYLVEVPVDTYLLRPVARLTDSGLYGSDFDTTPYLRKGLGVISVSGNRMTWAGRESYTWEEGTSLFHGMIGTAGTTSWSWTMLDSKGQQLVPFGGSVWMSGGLVSQIDGVHVAEANFAYSPQYATATPAAGAGTYVYAFSYLWLDNEGRVHESGLGPREYNAGTMSLGVTASAAAFPISLDVQNLSLTNRRRGGSGVQDPSGNPIAVRVYRTENGSPVLQFLGDYDMDHRSQYTTISDPGTSVASNAAAYTEGALPYGQLVSSRHMAVFDNRLIAAVDTSARVSVQATSDRAPQFIDHGSFYISTRDGAATEAVAVMDDTACLFKNDRIYLSSGGQGPAPNGSPPYADPRLFSADIGCTNSLSVLSTPSGIVFESDSGLQLMPRGFSGIQWVGAQPQEVLESYPTINGSALHPVLGLAMWSLQDSTPTYGKILVLDYALGAWSTWTVNSSGKFPAIGVVDGSLWLSSGSAIWREDGTNYGVSGEGYVGGTVTTEKIHPSNFVTGFSRVSAIRVHGEYRAPTTLKVELNIDEGGWNFSKEWVLPDDGQSAGTRIVKEWIPPQQKGDVFQVRVTDSVNGEYGGTESVCLHSLTLDVAARKNAKPLHEKARG